MCKSHFLGPVTILCLMERDTISTGGSLPQADLIDHFNGDWRIIVDGLFVPCEISCQKTVAFIGWVLGKTGSVEEFL